MFRRTKTTIQEATFAGWTERHLRVFAERCTGKEPIISFSVSGLRHVMRIGQDWGKNDHSVRHEQELVGRMEWPPALFQCSFGVRASDDNKLGVLSITGKGFENEPHSPLVSAHFQLQSRDEERELTRTLQAALVGRGAPYINLKLASLQNPDGWVEHVKSTGWSPAIDILQAIVVSETGAGPFE